MEVSIEQLRTQFVDTGKITPKTFEDIISASANKSAYATWLVSRVAQGMIQPEDVYKFKDYIAVFNRRKREYETPDLAAIKDEQALDAFINTSVKLLDKEREDVSTAKGVSKKDKYAEFKIGEVDGYTVYKLPKGRTDLYGASCELGSGTEWCTATGKTDSMFLQYIERGPLYIFDNGQQKYQFSYETNQFMDKRDRNVNIIGDPKKVYPLFKFIEDYGGPAVPERILTKPKVRSGMSLDKEVSMTFGRITRGGPGIEGTYDELKKHLSAVSERNAETVQEKLNLKWDRMIIYVAYSGADVTTLFAIHGTDENGKEFMYDRGGVGAAGYSKIYSSGGTKVNVSAVTSGAVTAADFK